MLRILLIDNYDSFTFNLVHLLEASGKAKLEVVKNDQIPFAQIKEFDKLVLSPGPGIPSEAGQMPELLQNFAEQKPILGICLGMQAIAERFSSPLRNLSRVYHGLAKKVQVLEKEPLFRNCPDVFLAARYHSWVVDEKHLHQDLKVTALDEDDLLMGIRHKHLPVYGLQFHPESILTKQGQQILENWLDS